MAAHPRPTKQHESAVEMTIGALNCHPCPSPLDDPDMRYVDPSPGSLDLVLRGRPDSRHAAESRAARDRVKGRSSRRG